MLNDQPVVAHDHIRYLGEPLALVAAESAEIALAALPLIEVEWEEMPAVYDAVEATNAGAPTLHDNKPGNVFRHAKLRHGDLEAGFAAADEILEETYYSPVAQQASLEPHVAAAQWANGQLTVWSATQAPYRVKEVLSELFGINPENVRVIVPHMGGGFGGKGHVRIEPMVAALAWKIGGRPVRLALTRAEEFVTVTKHAATITIKSGVKRDGTITARQVTIHWNGGAYADASPALVRSGMVRAGGPYRIPAIRIDLYGCYTNLPPAAAFRGAMSSQTSWAYESHMDSIAHLLRIDPLELRRKN
jgi:CO/xanthine dehydrogenase Mo-binding subunit